MNSPLIIERLVASFLETSPLYPPLLRGEGVGGEVQAERIKRQYARVWYYTIWSHKLLFQSGYFAIKDPSLMRKSGLRSRSF